MSDRLLLGAHVSTAGGIATAPARGAAIGATAIQIFTKTPNQWREPRLSDDEVEAFHRALAQTRIAKVLAHDSYLINLASPDARLRRRSIQSFTAELERCRRLGITHVVSHPGHFMDHADRGLSRNAEAVAECLAAVTGPTVVIECTAGAGTALGARFEELAELRDRIPPALRGRMEFCADTCHLFAAGFDLVERWDEVWDEWDRTIGLTRLRCLHLNDSRGGLGSRIDRHAWIAEGQLGPDPFRRIMREDRFRHVIKIIETPKGDDAVKNDRRMLARLRGYAMRRAT